MSEGEIEEHGTENGRNAAIYTEEIIHSFIQAISIAPLQVHYYSKALLTHHGYCAGVSRRSATEIPFQN